MRETITISDLTTMGNDKVCIAGIGAKGQCIRPVLPNGVWIRHFYIGGSTLVIRPRAKVRFNLSKVALTPPHIEDMGFDPSSVTYQGLCSDLEWESVLQKSSFGSVQKIYDGLLQEPRWVEPGSKTRSLGTLSQVEIIDVNLEQYRLSFRDSTSSQYNRIIIQDLAFRAFSNAEVGQSSATTASSRVRNLLTKTNRLYLRLGLARPWNNPNTGRTECVMQVTGIHTFPDYLVGRTFADFAP